MKIPFPLIPLPFLALALLMGCEENPITEGLLKASPPDENRRNARGNQEEAVEELNFTGFYQGETGNATISDTDDAVTMAVNSYRLWHLQRVQQSLDNLVRELVAADDQNQQFELGEIWSGPFTGENCGDESAISINNDGATGRVDFDGFCVVGVNRTDNFPFTLNGRMEWEDARVAGTNSLNDPEPARRTVSFEDLQVEWRGASYSLTGRNILSSENGQFIGGLDARLEGSEREWRIMTQREQISNQQQRFIQQLFVDDLGAMVMSTSSDPGNTWVTSSVDCTNNQGAGSGGSQLNSQDESNQAFFQMRLATCDQFNLLGSEDGQSPLDSRGRDLNNGPFNLADKL
ncbi:MAG: hypothetical protein EA349_06795 [Halomonadaceae bacterium]|nr:MAG: hypothetical protein EA349_06795 [Halomonadaceae bacterium]